MAFYYSSNTNQTNLAISGSTSSVGANRIHAVPTTVYHRQELGPVSVAIKPIALAAPCMSMAPASAAQVYTLPTAAQILQVFGRNMESGKSRMYAGTVMELQFMNRGAFPCTVSATAAGGDGSYITCATGDGYSGMGTKIFLEFTSVSSGLNGCTGDYVIYPCACGVAPQ
jgi:hypothetical protein